VTAENFLQTNPGKAKDLIKNKLGLDNNYWQQNWPKHNFVVTLDQSLLINLETEARWIITNNITNKTTVPNYLNFIYFDGLTQVKPEAVTIFH
jgi:NitT/TauT family transport system substrate-binding protein